MTTPIPDNATTSFLRTRYSVGTQMYINSLLTYRGWHWHLCVLISHSVFFFFFLPLVCVSRRLAISALMLWTCCPQVPFLSFLSLSLYSRTTIPSHSHYLSNTRMIRGHTNTGTSLFPCFISSLTSSLNIGSSPVNSSSAARNPSSVHESRPRNL